MFFASIVVAFATASTYSGGTCCGDSHEVPCANCSFGSHALLGQCTGSSMPALSSGTLCSHAPADTGCCGNNSEALVSQNHDEKCAFCKCGFVLDTSGCDDRVSIGRCAQCLPPPSPPNVPSPPHPPLSTPSPSKPPPAAPRSPNAPPSPPAAPSSTVDEFLFERVLAFSLAGLLLLAACLCVCVVASGGE